MSTQSTAPDRRSSIIFSPSRWGEYEAPKSPCFKGFIIMTIVLAAFAMITAMIAILKYHGTLTDLNSLNRLLKIGIVNSYFVLFAGAILFTSGIAAWCHNSKKESGFIN